MATQYGVSFQPGGEESGPNGQRRSAPVQEAVRMLSLRLPTVTGARGISPQALLQSPGGAGANTGGFSLEAALELLRKLRGANQPPQLQMPSAGIGMPPTAPGGAPVSTALPQPGRDLRSPSGPPRVIPGQQAPADMTKVWEKTPPPTGGGAAPPVAPDYADWLRDQHPAPTGGGDFPPLAPRPERPIPEPPRTEAQQPWETDFGWFMDRDEYHRG